MYVYMLLFLLLHNTATGYLKTSVANFAKTKTAQNWRGKNFLAVETHLFNFDCSIKGKSKLCSGIHCSTLITSRHKWWIFHTDSTLVLPALSV